MLFNSLEFALFFPVVTLLFFMLPHRFRWFMLLAASCYFYMVFIPVYILILAATILVDYAAGIMIENAKGKTRRTYLLLSIITNVGFLAFFKYANFFIFNLNEFASLIHWNYSMGLLNIILPIGLSFHTFQAMSYTIEVYRGHQKAERHLGIYALFVMFYPQLVAGPIERSPRLLPQFRKKHTFNYKRVVSGLRLMLWGLFKKIVIADNLANIVNQVYDHPAGQNALTYIIATLFFAFQIYSDFSGYSDIARGAAKVMGFQLMRNFNIPYLSASVNEFWQRWHISLSSWFRDYVFLPMTFRKTRYPQWNWIRATLLVFLISGLWHGAAWTFVIWGLIHGTVMVVERLTGWQKKNKRPILQALKIIVTFIIILFSWIFFRAQSLQEAFTIIRTCTTQLIPDINGLLHGQPSFVGFGEAIPMTVIVKMVFFIVVLYSADLVMKAKRFQRSFSKHPVLRFAIYYLLLYSILFLGYFGEVQFVYFQF